MKKLLILTVFVALIATLNSTAQNNKNDIIGKWKYESPTAPYGYETGFLVFSEKEGELAGEIQFMDGSKVEFTKLTYEDGVVKCGMYIEYNYITMETKVEDKKMTGQVDTPDGKIELKAEKTE